MKWALIDSQNIVKNIIAYDGVSPYRVPDGMSLVQINDWVGRDEPMDKSAPLPPVDRDPADVKAKRDEVNKSNLALIAAFEIEKKTNPLLEWSAYLDSLEQKAKEL